MDETDRPDDRRADGSWVLPNSESRRQRNHEAAQSGIQKRKKTRTYPRLSCKIEYLLASNHCDRSIASEFFTGDHLTAVINSELDQLKREISERQRYIEGQQVLIEVLEHDGHDVREQEIALNNERSKLDQQLELLRLRQA
jgi:hypothetical protein